jgi:DNA-binding NarL/FixJ family response regulator
VTIRLLLADDHAMMREGLKALVAASADITVVGEAGNGRDALHLVGEICPDVVVMDLAMPELNGIDATRALARRHPQVRVVILSMHSSSEHIFRAFDAGALGYVLKDSLASELVAAVRAAFGGRQYLSRAIPLSWADLARKPGRAGPLESLSGREREVLQLVVEGHSSAEIGEIVHLSRKSVETYRSRLMKKLGVPDFASLIKFAVEHGLTPRG